MADLPSYTIQIDLFTEHAEIGEIPLLGEEERLLREFWHPNIYRASDSVIRRRAMLEGHHCVFPRRLLSLCEQDSDWAYMRSQLPDATKSKRFLNEEESGEFPDENSDLNGNRRKLPMLCDSAENLAIVLAPSGDSDKLGRYGNNYDSSSLIHALGRDISINCLMRLPRSEYGSIASLNQGFRSLVRTGELYKLRRLASITEHWIYFSCNVLEWEAFDPYTRRWMHLPRMPSNECFMCSDKESLAVGTELLVFGIEVTSHIVIRYSILTNSWSSGVAMNSPRCLFGSASFGEKAIIAGGCNSLRTIYSSAELYNSETQTWETLPSMNIPRKMCSGVFMDGKFYVIGGTTTNNKILTCGEEFDLETRRWRVIDDMFPALTGEPGAPPLVAVVNNELYSADYAKKKLRKYNKKNNLWITLGDLPERSVSVNGWGLAFRACGERLMVIGGPRAAAGGNIHLNSWIPGEGPPVWELIGRKPSGSFVYNCAVMSC